MTQSFGVIDFLFPRGVLAIDTTIAIEHVRPINAGGDPVDLRNLRLACNYCNSIKSDALTLYSRGQYAQPINHPHLGYIFPPNPYWVPRLLAVDGKCSSCDVTAAAAQLCAATRTPLKYMNPVNLEVYCTDHDPLRDFRWISRANFKRLGDQP